MKKILLILVLALFAWLNTFRVSYNSVRDYYWKDYGGHSRVFLDAITFDSETCHLNDNGEIYNSSNIYLGKIIDRRHNYVNTMITVVDSANDTAIYIAKGTREK
jgi:hypothetical protein